MNEYAIRRDKDNAWLSDPDWGKATWEHDADNATWSDTRDDALDLAARHGIGDGDALPAGYAVWTRPWVDEADITEDYENPEPTRVD